MNRIRSSRAETCRIDLDPLTAIRRELVSAAERKAVARQRRKRAFAASLATIAASALAAGSLAATNAGTGVPAIDRFLDIASETPLARSDPLADGHEGPRDDHANPPRPIVRALAGSASPPFPVPLGDDRNASAVGYTSQDGAICAALTDSSPRADALNGLAACAGADFLSRMLERSPVVTVSEGQPHSSVRVVQGYASGNVQSIAVLGMGAGVKTALSEAWTPPGWDGRSLRVFFVTQPTSGSGTPLALSDVRLQARLADGRTVGVAP